MLTKMPSQRAKVWVCWLASTTKRQSSSTVKTILFKINLNSPLSMVKETSEDSQEMGVSAQQVMVHQLMEATTVKSTSLISKTQLDSSARLQGSWEFQIKSASTSTQSTGPSSKPAHRQMAQAKHNPSLTLQSTSTRTSFRSKK